jgi:arylsulfatase A-like enzyme
VGSLRDRGLLDDTLIVVTSDHGEEFLDHGSLEGHQWTLYDEVLHVPLVIRPPGGGEAKRVDRLVSLLDVAPTILDLLRLTPPATFEGASLVPWMGGTPPATRAPLVYSEISRFNERTAARSSTHKLVGSRIVPTESGKEPWIWWQLFDLTADPTEQTNLYGPDHPIATQLHAALASWYRPFEPATGPSTPSPFTAEELARLEALGYVQPPSPTPPQP